MRFILSVLAAVAGLVMLVTGGVQFAEAARVTSITAAGSSASGAPLLVVEGSQLAAHAGTQHIEIRGSGPIIVATGRANDVLAWVGDTRHERVAIDTEAAHDGIEPLVFTVAGAADSAPAPATSDLWTEVREGEGELVFDTVVAPGYAMLIASDGKAPAPGELSITWPHGGYAPWSGPLLVTGGLLLVIAGLLLVWAVLRRRRKAREAELAPPAPPAIPEPERPAAAAEDAPERWTVVPWHEEEAPAPDLDLSRPFEPESADDEPLHTDTITLPAMPEEDAVVSPVEAWSPEAAELIQPEPEPEPAPSAPETPGIPEPERIPDAASLPEPQRIPEAPSTPDAVPPHFTGRPDAPAAPVGGVAGAVPPHFTGPADAGAAVPAPEPDPVPAPEPAPAAPVAEPVPSEPAAGPAPAAPAPAEPSADDDDSKWRRPRGRNRSSAPKRQFFMAPVALAGALMLAGCSPQYWPQAWTGAEVAPTGTPTSTADAAILGEGSELPVLTEAKLGEIIADAAAVAAQADEQKDALLLEPRFAGDALAERSAHYSAQKADGNLAGPVPFPTGAPVYVLPEATDEWPRVAFAVVAASADPASTTAPFAITLQQDQPRTAYRVHSIVQIAPGVSLPEAAPAEIGADALASVADGLVLAPDQLAAAYADVIAKGDGAEHAALFDPANDLLRDQVDQAYRDGEAAKLDPQVATIGFAYAASDTPPIGLTTLDGGAIVAVSITERETLKAVNDRSRITVAGRTAALAGLNTSPYGFERTYTDQVLFYVPPASAGGKIIYLGASQAMTGVKELTKEEANIGG